MKQIIIRFGLLAIALSMLFHLSKYSLFTQSMSMEVWVTLFALLEAKRRTQAVRIAKENKIL